MRRLAVAAIAPPLLARSTPIATLSLARFSAGEAGGFDVVAARMRKGGATEVAIEEAIDRRRKKKADAGELRYQRRPHAPPARETATELGRASAARGARPRARHAGARGEATRAASAAVAPYKINNATIACICDDRSGAVQRATGRLTLDRAGARRQHTTARPG